MPLPESLLTEADIETIVKMQSFLNDLAITVAELQDQYNTGTANTSVNLIYVCLVGNEFLANQSNPDYWCNDMQPADVLETWLSDCNIHIVEANEEIERIHSTYKAA